MRSRILLTIALLLLPAFAQGESPGDSFGQRQLAQVLLDRPSMSSVFPSDDVVYRWVVRRLDTGAHGERVRWDAQEPLSGRTAENQAAHSRGDAIVRLTSDADVSGRDKWFMLVFELHNIPHPNAADELSRLVREQQIGREEFALRCVEHEFIAMQRTLRFFSRYPIPDAKPENAPLYLQYTDKRARGSDFQAYVKHLDRLPADEYDPRDYFARWYDQLYAYHYRTSRAEPSHARKPGLRLPNAAKISVPAW